MVKKTTLICTAFAVFLAGPGQAQVGVSETPIIEVRHSNCGDAYPKPCGTFLVNRSLSRRVVATLQSTPSFALYVEDKGGNGIPLRQDVRPVLVQPGQSLKLMEKFSFELSNVPAKTRSIDYSYAVLGYYEPSPDLTELPRGAAEDSLRFVETTLLYNPNLPMCSDKHGGKMWGYTAYNFNGAHPIIFTFTNKLPGYQHNPQTRILLPGEGYPVGCINDWQTDFVTSNIRFAD